MAFIHDGSIFIDGLIIAKWDRSIFEDMRRGGLSAASCTVSVWEGLRDTLANIADMKALIRQNADLVSLVRCVDDIRQAQQEGKTGIILSFQNTSAYEDLLGSIEAFSDMGVRIVQLCYNTQNFVGTGCYERDGGLSGYGREVIAEMNRCGVLIDLSHVGAETSRETILASKRPVCYSHCLPTGLKAHSRNKSDEELRFLADRGGFIGVTMFPPFLRRGVDATVDDYVEAFEYIIQRIGEDCVGIGSDFTQGYDKGFFDWITHDKGRYRKLTDFGPILNPEGIRTIGEFPNLVRAMERAGWTAERIEKVLGLNWLRFYEDAWNTPHPSQ